MKKILTCLTALSMGAISVMANPIDEAKAQKIAETFLADGANLQLVAKAERNEAKARGLGKRYANTAPFYIYSRGENKGFVIVSGDDCLPKILGYTESGNYDEENMPESFKGLLDYYAAVIEEAQVNGAPARATERTINKSWQTIEPLVKTHWHQSWPYYNRTPYVAGTTDHTLTGCVCTAGAQVAFYFKKDLPDYLLAATPTYSYGAPVTYSYPKGTPMKWALMQNSYSGSEPYEFTNAVAEFMAQLGAGAGLTYGTSTSGHTFNLEGPFRNFYNLSSEHAYKSSFSQTAWENLLYSNLASGRPVVYSGVVPNEDSGHAVLVDGYDAVRGLFHFNFGWGGQSDGYYTVDDETGMNGFCSYMDMHMNVTPLRQNLKGSIQMPLKLYYNRTNVLTAKVQNCGTLDYSGIYLYANRTGKLPSETKEAAKFSDTETVLVADGEAVEFDMELKPTVSDGVWYVFLCDKNKNVIAQTEMEAVTQEADIVLKSISVSGSDQTEEYNGYKYKVVNNDRAIVYATITNRSNVAFDGFPTLNVYASEDGGNTFTLAGTRNARVTILPYETVDVAVSVINSTTCPVKSGNIYYAFLENPVNCTFTNNKMVYATNDTIVRFALKSKSLEVDNLDNEVLSFKGAWDQSAFNNLVSQSEYADIINFDLTGVDNVGDVAPLDGRPNALFYVDAKSNAKGTNVVKVESMKSAADKNSCEQFSLTVGYDFNPCVEFYANDINVDLNIPANRWNLICLPCNVDICDGVNARYVNSHSASGISNKTTDVTTIVAGTPHLVMASSVYTQTLHSANQLVSVKAENIGDPAFVGTYTDIEAPEGAYLINDEEKQQFELAESNSNVEAMHGYFIDETQKRAFNAYSAIVLDPTYETLGNLITDAYGAYNYYCEVVSSEARAKMKSAIASSEKLFANRTDVTITDVREKITEMTEVINSFILSLDVEVNNLNIDMTSKIVNPSFETTNEMGWTTSLPNSAIHTTTSLVNTAVGVDGTHFLSNIANTTDSTSTAISQVLTGLTPGYYTLEASFAMSKGNTATMYAGDKEVEAQPSPLGIYYLNDAVITDIYVGESGELEIGVKAGAWYKVDNFRLTYTGNVDSTVNGIEEISSASSKAASDVAVNAGEGFIEVQTKDTVTLTLYSITGSMVAQRLVDGRATFSGLPSGIYIIANKKVVVK